MGISGWRALSCAVWLSVLGLVLLCPQSFADGVYFPPQAFAKLPEIPCQRAVLTLRNGMERMVVESTFKGEGDRVGWVIPVPAAPRSFEAASPGFLKTLSINTQPEVIHDDDYGNGVAFLLYLAFILCCCISMVYDRGYVPAFRLILTLVFFAVFGLFMVGIMTPNFLGGSPKTTSIQGIQIEKQARVGNYNVEVVAATRHEGLNQWLEMSGFAKLSPEGIKIADDLIREKWHFVAARLVREGEGIGRPHPMAISFPSSELIYPMRLTALAGSPVYLELYTIADRQAVSDRLTTDFCGRFKPEHELIQGRMVYVPEGEENRDKRFLVNCIAHPDAPREMWPGCVVTRLSGTLRPRQMRSDIRLTWQEPTSYRRRVLYDWITALMIGAFTVLWGWFFGMLGWLLVRGRIAPGFKEDVERAGVWDELCGTFRKRLKRVVGWGTLGALLIGVLIFMLLPKTAATLSGWQATNTYPRSVSRFLWEYTLDHPNVGLAALRKGLQDELGRGKDSKWSRVFENRVTGEPLREEDSPGNYILYESGGKVFIRVYGWNGNPVYDEWVE